MARNQELACGDDIENSHAWSARALRERLCPQASVTKCVGGCGWCREGFIRRNKGVINVDCLEYSELVPSGKVGVYGAGMAYATEQWSKRDRRPRPPAVGSE